MKQNAPEKQTLEELSKFIIFYLFKKKFIKISNLFERDPEFRKNMKQFFGEDGIEESNKKNTVNENCLIFIILFFLRFSFFCSEKNHKSEKRGRFGEKHTKY